MALNTRSLSLPMPASPLSASPGPSVTEILNPNCSQVLFFRLSPGTITVTDFGGGSSDRCLSLAPDSAIITTPQDAH